MVRKPHFTAIIKEVNKRTERVNQEVGEFHTINKHCISIKCLMHLALAEAQDFFLFTI